MSASPSDPIAGPEEIVFAAKVAYEPAGSSGWRNEYRAVVPLLKPEKSDAEILAAMRAAFPLGSSWGALRWRSGVYDIRIDREARVVRFRESEGMAD